MDIPRYKRAKFTKFFGVWVTPELHQRVEKLKAFHGINTSELARRGLMEAVMSAEAEVAIGDQKIVNALELPNGPSLD